MDKTRPNIAITRPSPAETARTAVKKPNRLPLLGLIISTVVVLGVLLSLGAYALFQGATVILPGVEVGGMPVGGMDQMTAYEELDRVWNQEFTLTVIDSSDMERRWLAAPSEFGLSIDVEETAQAAVSVGRNGYLFQNLAQIWKALFVGVDVQPVVAFDPGRALAGFQSWSAEVDVDPIDAQIHIEDGQVRWTEAQPGRAVDFLASLDFLRQNADVSYVEQRAIPLIMSPVDANIEDVSQAVADLQTLLEASPEIRLYDPVQDQWVEWAPAPDEIVEWITIEPEGSTYQIGVEPEAVERYVAAGIDALGEERTLDTRQAVEALMIEIKGGATDPLIIDYLPRSHIVHAGDNLVSIGFDYGIPYWKIYEVNPDLVITGLQVGESIVIPARDAMLEMPVVPNKRIVISISQQHMWVYQDQQLLSEHVISTGIADSPTMPGLFQILTHEENAYAAIWDLYMPHFMGIYYATPDLLNGIHGLPMLSSGRRLWADVLGHPASYGCIILDLQAAEQLYAWAETGVVVEIQR
jgi:lipoprotein-anchoring transpeptidase ErfK/SrfK